MVHTSELNICKNHKEKKIHVYLNTWKYELFTILFLFIQYTVVGSDKIQVKTINLSTNNPNNSIISMVNTGTKKCSFNIKLNNEFYYDVEDIIKEIKSNDYNKENLLEYQKAWAFIKNRTYSFDPLSKKNWTSAITILINSLGYGQSEVIATCLFNLWQKLGYSSQLFKLGNYVISEIKIKDNWELYDAASGIYFKNGDNVVLNINDIQKQKNNIHFAILPHHPVSIYCNKYNNLISNIYEKLHKQFITQTVKPAELVDSLHFFIPPNGKIEIGAIFDHNLISEKGRKIPYFANLKLTIPKGYGGFIDNPLVIQSIQGEGIIKIGSREYEINSPELQNELTCGDEFIKYFQLIKAKTDINIIYTINPTIVKLKTDNIIKLIGTNIDKIDVQIKEIPDSLSINYYLKKQTLFYHPDRIKLFKFEKIDSVITTNTSELIEKIDFYFNQTNDNEKRNRIKNKITEISLKTPINMADSDIFKCLTYIPFEMFLYDIDNTTTTDFFEKLKYFGKEK